MSPAASPSIKHDLQPLLFSERNLCNCERPLKYRGSFRKEAIQKWVFPKHFFIELFGILVFLKTFICGQVTHINIDRVSVRESPQYPPLKVVKALPDHPGNPSADNDFLLPPMVHRFLKKFPFQIFI